jgi:hypothetical protein
MAKSPDRTPVEVRVERMLNEARARIDDASILSKSIARQSDADYLLDLLAFEILLKAVHLVHVGDPERHHSYGQIFNALPAEVQSALVMSAVERMSTSADYSNVSKLLAVFSENFIALRYPYEAYKALSTEQYAELGQSWVDRGAREDEATFIYHPQELYGLNYALIQHLEAFLGVAPS